MNTIIEMIKILILGLKINAIKICKKYKMIIITDDYRLIVLSNCFIENVNHSNGSLTIQCGEITYKYNHKDEFNAALNGFSYRNQGEMIVCQSELTIIMRNFTDRFKKHNIISL